MSKKTRNWFIWFILPMASHYITAAHAKPTVSDQGGNHTAGSGDSAFDLATRRGLAAAERGATAAQQWLGCSGDPHGFL